jgi:hypothetical protein
MGSDEIGAEDPDPDVFTSSRIFAVIGDARLKRKSRPDAEKRR